MASVDLTKLSPAAIAYVTEVAAAASREAADALRADAANALDRYGLGNGALAESLDVQMDSASGEALVVAAATHARFVEFGTQRQPARPFLGSSLEAARVSLTRLFAARIADALRALGPRV